MSEPALSKCLLTRRRVIVGAVMLVTTLAVAGFVFGVFDQNPSAAVKIMFLGASQARAEVASEATFSLKQAKVVP